MKTNPTPPSMKSSLLWGWKCFCNQPFTYLKFTYPYILIWVIGMTLTGIALFKYDAPQAVQFYLISKSQTQTDWWNLILTQPYTSWLPMMMTLIVSIFAYFIYRSSTYTLISFYNATEELPQCSFYTFNNTIIKKAYRTFIFDIIAYIPFLLLTYLILWLSSTITIGLIGVLIPIFIWWDSICICGRMRYVVYNDPLKKAYQIAFSHGHKRLGAFLTSRIITSIPYGITIFITFLPILCFGMSWWANLESQLYGHPSGLPPYTTVLLALSFIFFFSSVAIVWSLRQWSAYRLSENQLQ